MMKNTARLSVLTSFGLALYLLVTFGPLGALIGNAMLSQDAFEPGWLMLIIPFGRRLDLLWDSISLSLGVALGGMLLGILVATSLLNWSGKSLRNLRWFLFLLVPIPPYIHALAWQAFADFLNPWFRNWGLSPLGMRGWGASCWVWLMALAPFAVSLILIGMEAVDREIIEAGRIHFDDSHIFWGILLPLARPYILAVGGLLFVLSLTDYSITSLFQMNSYALEIFAEFSAHNQPGRVIYLSMPILVSSFAAITLVQAPLKSATLNPIWQRRALAQNWRWPGWFRVLQWSGMGILLLQISVPFSSLFFLTDSWVGFSQNIRSASSEIGFTLGVSTLTALLSLPLAYALALQLQQKRQWGWWLLVTLPLAIPAPLIGIGLISLWNRAFLSQIYASFWMPVLAALARFVPIAAIIITVQMRRVKPQLIEAAEILQSHGWRKILWIRIPLIGPGLLAAALMTFILALGELGATLLVVPAGKSTLTIRIYNFLHYGASQTVASLCLSITLLVLIFASAAALIMAAWSSRTSQTHRS
jgi:iron(III) transport system permease protein